MLLQAMPYPAGSGSDDILFYGPTPVSNEFDITGLDLSSGIQRIVLFLDELTVDTDNTQLILQFYISGSLVTSGYRYSGAVMQSGGLFNSEGGAPSNHIALSENTDLGTNYANSARVEIGIGRFKVCTGQLAQRGDGGGEFRIKGGLLEDGGTLTGLKVSGSGGLITGGRALLMAMQTS